MKKLVLNFFRFLSSYALACIILVFLTLLTYLGTVAQVEHGLYQTKKLYFESMLVMQPIGEHLVVPLPGVYLLMILFCINLLLGGIVRLRRKPSTIGLFVIHGGILMMMIGGLVEYTTKTEGQMTLGPGETSNEFKSYHEWELTMTNGKAEYVIGYESFDTLTGSHSRTFPISGLPFEVTLSGYGKNTRIRPVRAGVNPTGKVIGGFYIDVIAPDKQNERNIPALYLALEDKQTGETREEIVWGGSMEPLVYQSGGENWAIELQQRRWKVPFSLTLKKFVRELHPGTEMARNFQSDVIKTDGKDQQTITIRMNEPLRDSGYTFFQSSFHEDPQTGIFYSTFAVVNNPADNIPLYSCYIITLGMLIQFGLRLNQYLKRERKQQS